ncbi:amidohydrolase family protein [Steroidobacter sp.]|uniref:amidohydrolase family protein n=1 Tax=Steroidobacter sp. TaxID=1978227 RepID=UPI0025DF038A|nr:amidohydrolase family protein [Steroidobacter sp.]
MLAAMTLSVVGGAAADQPLTADPVARVSAVYALTHARLVIRPGEVIDDGVLIVRDGVIAAVGAKAKIPNDARVLDLQGRTVFAGFIDARSDYGQKGIAAPKEDAAIVVPQEQLIEHLNIDPAAAESLRQLGFTSVVSQPRYGVFRGQAAVLTTAQSERLRDVVVAPAVAQTLAFEKNVKATERYPVFSGGATAVLRQTLLDAQWQGEYAAWQAKHRDTKPLEPQSELTALQPALAGRQPVLFDSKDELDLERAYRIANEFKLNWVVNGTGYEYRYAQQLKKQGARVIVPLNPPAAPSVGNADETDKVVLADLEHWEWAPFNARMLADAGVPFAFTTAGLKNPRDFWKQVRDAVAHGLDEKTALSALTETPAQMLGLGNRIGSLKAGLRAQLVVADADLFRANDAKIYEVWVDGQRQVLSEASKTRQVTANAAKPPLPGVLRYPSGEYGRVSLPEQPQAVLVKGATVWTQGPQGQLAEADLLVERGRIKAVGKNLSAPATAVQVDGRGLHVTPGLIDTHSHIALNRGSDYGESSDHITSEVANSDILKPHDITIYRQLTDGVTSVLLLQGSANPINGQSQAIKLRWGADAEGLKIAGAPPSMKLALGENSKQAAWGMGKRFPLTRMGVQESVHQAFVDARAYMARRAEKNGPPMRRDLRLEATAEILTGKSTMHVHSYRQSEVSAFLQLCREFNVKPVFHHINEGYKVADEMAAAGAGASAFIDYWGTKLEASDGTYYNPALMVRQGVLVTLSSDTTYGSVPRLNLDAAYTVGYGGLSETEALNLVTINGAKQMGVSNSTGSLEVGKDADFVVWSDNPLSPRAIALQTWIDGRRYFDRDSDQQEHARIASERARLIARVRQGDRQPVPATLSRSEDAR